MTSDNDLRRGAHIDARSAKDAESAQQYNLRLLTAAKESAYVRALEMRDHEITRLTARVAELEGQHKGLVLQNALLRQRPDLPADRIPAAKEVEALTAEVERLRAVHEAAHTRGFEDGKALRVKQKILIHKQADEITHLTARVAQLEGALEKINVGEGWAAILARAALTQPAKETADE